MITKSAKKFLSLFCTLSIVISLTACNNTSTKSSLSSAEGNTSSSSELIVAGNEIAIGVDPTVYPAADYILNMGAGEVLFKPQTHI